MKFPDTFFWGAAASSYQIEGAPYRQGGGRSVWDMMGRHQGKIVNSDTGDIACDHYHRYQQDVELMADIGLQAYRFSVSWPRVLPAGTGAVNQRGLDFYQHLVDALLEKNITPWLTLFHWDFPYELYCRGGWLNRDSAHWFADYTALIVDALSDRVSHWCTLNEPQVYIGLGHDQGTHAPGLPMAYGESLRAAHHTLLAHGKAVQVIRARAKTTPFISASHAGSFYMPETETPQAINAAREWNFAVKEKGFFNNTWFSDPMILGRYPEDGVALYGADMPTIQDGDMETIAQPLDYFGTNIYWGSYIRANTNSISEVVENDPLPTTAMDWPITPEVLYWAPRFFYQRYNLPLVITENGMAADDHLHQGEVNDQQRVDFLRRYISEYGRAIADGVPCLGYFVWSLMDNFEWAEGYAKRFGIVHVDYNTQARVLKESAKFYRQIIAGNAVPELKEAMAQTAS